MLMTVVMVHAEGRTDRGPTIAATGANPRIVGKAILGTIEFERDIVDLKPAATLRKPKIAASSS
jgi:hypothetical protein